MLYHEGSNILSKVCRPLKAAEEVNQQLFHLILTMGVIFECDCNPFWACVASYLQGHQARLKNRCQPLKRCKFLASSVSEYARLSCLVTAWVLLQVTAR